MADPADLLSGVVLDASKPVAGLDLLPDLPAAPGPFKKGFGAGVATLKAAGGGLISLAGRAVGSAPVEGFGAGITERANEEAAPLQMKVEDVDSFGAGVDFAKYAAGTVLPTALAMGATALLGRGFGSLAARGAATQGAATAARLKDIGTVAGGAAGSIGIETGSIFPEAVQQGVENPIARSLAGGTAAGLLDTVMPLILARRLGIVGAATNTTPRAPGFGVIAKGAAKTAVATGAGEAATETAQSVIERLAAGQDLTGPDAISDYVNSAAIGLVGGHVFGAPAGALATASRPIAGATQNAGTSAQVPTPGAPSPSPDTGAVSPPGVTNPLQVPTTAEDSQQDSQPPPFVEAADRPTPLGQARLDHESAAAAHETLVQKTTGISDRLTALDTELADPKRLRTKREITLERRKLGEELAAAQPAVEAAAQAKESARAALKTQEIQASIVESPKTPKIGSVIPNSGVIALPGAEIAAPDPAAVAEIARQKDASDLHDALDSRKQGKLLNNEQAKLARGFDTRVQATVPVEPVFTPDSRQSRESSGQLDPVTAVGEREARGIGAAADVVPAIVAEKFKASRTNASESKRAALTKQAVDLVNAEVQKASGLSSIEARQAAFEAGAHKSLTRLLDKESRQDIIDTVSPTLYSKGVVDNSFQARREQQLIDEEDREFREITKSLEDVRTSNAFKDVVETASPWMKSMAPLVTKARALWDSGANVRIGQYDVRWALGQADSLLANYHKLADEAVPMAGTGSKPDRTALAVYMVRDIKNTGPEIRATLEEFLRDAATTRAGLNMRSKYQRADAKLIDDALNNVESLFSEAALTTEEFHALPQDAKHEVVDYYDRAMTERGQQLIGRIRDMVGDDPHLTINTFTAAPGSPIGGYTRLGPLKSLISLALNAKQELSIADHEGFHYAEDRILTPAERMIIRNALAPGKPLFKKLAESVQRYDREHKTNLTDEILSSAPERNAYAFEFWKRGELQVEGALARVFQKIREFLTKIANLIRGQGFQSIEDIFTALDRGQFAERARRPEGGIAEITANSQADVQGWYRSALTDAVTALPMKQGSAQGWKDTIKGLVARGAVKQVEVDAVGLNDFLDLRNGKVSKDEVVSFLRENGVRVEETVLGGKLGQRYDHVLKTKVDDTTRELRIYREDSANVYGEDRAKWPREVNQKVGEIKARLDAAIHERDKTAEDREPLFEKWQLPGGTNYRELLLRLPGGESREDAVARRDAAWTRISERIDYPRGQSDLYGLRWAEENVPGLYAEWQDASRAANKKPTASNVGAFNSSHFDQPNILAHVRFNERTDAEGKRVLFVEEFQSDWAQKGKKGGFMPARPADKTALPPGQIMGEFTNTVGHFYQVEWSKDSGRAGAASVQSETRQGAVDYAWSDLGYGGTPAAPFVASRKFGVFKENTELAFDKGELVNADEGKPSRFDTREKAEAFAKKYSAEVRDLGMQADTPAWVALSLKRMIRYAAENGFDKVAWTTGLQQINRYPEALRQVADKIRWTTQGEPHSITMGEIEKLPQAEQDVIIAEFVRTKKYPVVQPTNRDIRISKGGTLIVRATISKDGKVLDSNEPKAFGKDLSELIGKPMTEQVLKEQSGEIKGQDFTVGGKGMQDFYDKIVPNVANDVLKKLGGGKVGEVSIPVAATITATINPPGASRTIRSWRVVDHQGRILSEHETEGGANKALAGLQSKQPGFTITPELATRAAAGLPLFSKGAAAHPEDGKLDLSDFNAALTARYPKVTVELGMEGDAILFSKIEAKDSSTEGSLAGYGVAPIRDLIAYANAQDRGIIGWAQTKDKVKLPQERLVNFYKKLGFEVLDDQEWTDSAVMYHPSPSQRRAHANVTGTVQGQGAQPGTGTADSGQVSPAGQDAGRGGGETLNSRAAAEAAQDIERRYKHGELPESQFHDYVTGVMDDAQTRPMQAREATSALAQGGAGAFTRARTYIATGNYISKFSEGYKNGIKALSALELYKNRLIAQGSEVGLSTWHAANQLDRDVTFDALLKRRVAGALEGTPEFTNIRAGLTQAQMDMFDQVTGHEGTIAKYLKMERAAEAIQFQRIMTEPEFAEWQTKQAEQVKQLIDNGYVPERRYGDHVVRLVIDVQQADGSLRPTTASREQFETEAQAIQRERDYAAEIASTGSGLRVERGIRHKQEHDQELGIAQFLDLARRQGIRLQQVEIEKLSRALISADSIRRNRLMRTKHTPGMSKEGWRVLNEFITGMSGKIAHATFSDGVNAALAGKPVDAFVDPEGNPHASINSAKDANLWAKDGPKSGFYRNILDQRADTVFSPTEGSEISTKLKTLAMTYFIGGSLGAGVVQMFSVPMNTVPYLSQHTSYTNALATTLSAWSTTMKNSVALRDLVTLENPAVAIPAVDSVPGLRAALITAAQDGTNSSTEIHQIMGISRGGWLAQSKRVQRALDVWMWPFKFGENTSRIASFIAAYRLASEGGGVALRQPDGTYAAPRRLGGRELYEFAKNSVDETQNRFDPVNRPAIAAHPIGSLLFMFKSFPLFVVEMLETMFRQNPKAATTMLLGLVMMTGIQGLPFAEDILDLVDVISQKLFNSPFNARRKMRNLIKDASEAMVGVDASNLIMRGLVNELTGMNVATRVGNGDIIPGTRIGAADTDYARGLEQILGAPFSMLVAAGGQVDNLAGGMLKGDFEGVVGALRAGGPVAVRNLIKGYEQLDGGFAKDAMGRRLSKEPVSTIEALFQGVGISSATLTKLYDLDAMDRQSVAFYKQAQGEFTRSLTKALLAGDAERAADIYKAMADFTESNPEMPLITSAASLRRQMVDAGLPLNARTLRNMPRALRGTSVAIEGL